MPSTGSPRINVVFEPALFERIARLARACARAEYQPLASIVRNLVKEALEAKEDAALDHLADSVKIDRKRIYDGVGAGD